jgi:hypothetical protein
LTRLEIQSSPVQTGFAEVSELTKLVSSPELLSSSEASSTSRRGVGGIWRNVAEPDGRKRNRQQCR